MRDYQKLLQSLTTRSKQIRKGRKIKNGKQKVSGERKIKKNKRYRESQRDSDNDDPDRGSHQIVYVDTLSNNMSSLKKMMEQINFHIDELEE